MSINIPRKVYVNQPEYVISQAKKLVVQSSFLSTKVIQADLISSYVTSSCRSMIDTVKQDVMNVIWNTLESIADSPAHTTIVERELRVNIEFKSKINYQIPNQSISKETSIAEVKDTEQSANFAGVSWKQVVGFYGEFGTDTVDTSVLEQLLQKTKGVSPNYETVAHIAKSKEADWLSKLFLLRAINLKLYP